MTAFSWVNGLIGGLLISSCCVIQLLLNLFGIGCAGLNTLLLPYRPVFISLTVISLTYAFWRSRPSKWHFATVLTVTLLLSFSPEILRTYNNYQSVDSPLDQTSSVTHWQITGMHCEGCRSAVIQALKSLDGVRGVHVDLATGKATLTAEQKIAPEKIIQVVKSAGFQAEEGNWGSSDLCPRCVGILIE